MENSISEMLPEQKILPLKLIKKKNGETDLPAHYEILPREQIDEEQELLDAKKRNFLRRAKKDANNSVGKCCGKSNNINIKAACKDLKLLKCEVESGKEQNGLEMLEGGQQSKKKQRSIQFIYSSDEEDLKLTKTQFNYLILASDTSLSSVTANEYFTDKALVYKFGVSALLKARLGYCEASGLWKIYIHKANPNFKPSIVSINYLELAELKSLLQETLDAIEDGNKTGNYYLMPEGDLKSWTPEKTDTAYFWQKNVTFLSSGNFRIRVDWNYGNHNVILNNPAPNTSFEKYFGPKIKCGLKDIKDLISIIDDIVSKCPTYEEMMEFCDD